MIVNSSRRCPGILLLPGLVVVLVLGILPLRVIASENVNPMSTAPVYFPETGFWVDPLFQQFWERNGGLMTFGYPISRVFYQDGLYRQYFERAIFEHHEDRAGTPWAVQLVRLGAFNTIERRRTDPLFQPRPYNPTRDRDLLFFPETGHAIDTTFQPYWEANGGIQAFGYPLSEPFYERSREDGVSRLVQYFERARFEYHPERADRGFPILLGHLGREALTSREVPEIAITPQSGEPDEADAPPLGPLPVGEPSPVGCGFNFFAWGKVEEQELNVQYLDMAAASGCEWIRMQFLWSYFEPEPGYDITLRMWAADQVVNLARERDLKLLIDVTHVPAWALRTNSRQPIDAAAYGDFFSRLAEHFAGRIDAWQIWNEPNLIDGDNPPLRPAEFLPLLRAAYPAIKEADPDALVVFPGLAPTSLMEDGWVYDDDWWLEALLEINQGEAARWFDVLGVQAYGAGNHPDTYYPGNISSNPEWVNAPEFYFRHVEQLRAVMVNAGLEEVPVWIAEMGWPVGVQHPSYGYGRYVTERLQARYIARAFEIMRTEWDWVEVAMVWNLNAAGYGEPDNPFSGFSVTNAEGSPRPAYDAIIDMVTSWEGDATP